MEDGSPLSNEREREGGGRETGSGKEGDVGVAKGDEREEGDRAREREGKRG